LPCADASVDVQRCERVFQHHGETERAAAEIARVLRPGGRAVVLDSDWATAVIHPGDPEVVRVMAATMLRTAANPYSARRIPGQLTAAGLDVADIGSEALLQPAEAATGPLVQLMARRAHDDGAISAEQHERLLADLAGAATRGDFFMTVTMFAVLARKPS
ncbi:MAG: methyltransferase domain-containing protein, partial [Thermocrispum sp.]